MFRSHMRKEISAANTALKKKMKKKMPNSAEIHIAFDMNMF